MLLEEFKNLKLRQRIAALENPSCRADILDYVSQRCKSHPILRLVAIHTNTSVKSLRHLALRNKDAYIRLAAIHNRRCPPEAIKLALETDSDWVVRWGAINHPSCPVDAIMDALSNSDLTISRRARERI